MKIKCRCGEILTKDLYLTKRWHCWDVVEDYYFEGQTKHYMEIKEGSFQLSTQMPHLKHWKRFKHGFWVNPNDVLDKTQMVFKSGYGCCGLAWEPYHCPSCDEVVGEINLDCYQDHHVQLFFNKTQRSYK